MSYELKKVKIASPNSSTPSNCLATSSKSIHTTKLPDSFETCLLILLELENTSRNTNDLESNQKIILDIVKLCAESKNWRRLGECAQILTKKMFAKKDVIKKMVQECMSHLNNIIEKDFKVLLISDLRNLSKGNIYLESERAYLTKALADIKEEDGLLKEASEILNELKVESISALSSVEKIELLLHQMRLFVATGQIDRALLLSKKVSTNILDYEGNEILKLAYYKLVVKLELSYENTSRYYTKMSEIKILTEEEKLQMVANALIFSFLAPFDNEKITLMEGLLKNSFVEKHKNFKAMLIYFLSQELINMNEFCDNHYECLNNLGILIESTTYGNKVRQDLSKRFVEHVSTYVK